MATENFDYTKAWAEVCELDQKRLPRQALDKVLEIRANARSEKNYFQVIKSYAFGIDYAMETGATDEEMNKGLMDEIRAFEADASGMPADYKAISLNRLAHCYSALLESRIASIRRRSGLEDDSSPDMETWGVSRFRKEILQRFSQSLECKSELWKKGASGYKDLIKWNTDIDSLPATLYDHLALDMLQYLEMQGEPSDFSFSSPGLLAPAKEFAQFKPGNQDTGSADNLRLGLYQGLVESHLDDQNKEILLEMDARRLKYYLSRSTSEDASSVYMSTLEKMRQTYKSDSQKPESAEGKVCFMIAECLENQGKRKEAHDFALEMSGKFSNPNLRYIAKNIERKQLSFNCENYVSPGQEFPICLSYTNLDKVYIRVVKIRDEELLEKNRWNMLGVLLGCNAVWEKEFGLRNAGDFLGKTSELIIGGLEPGIYGIIASSDSLFKKGKSEVMAFQDIRACKFAVVKDGSSDSKAIFSTLDRMTGKALPGVKLSVCKQKKKVFEAESSSSGTIEVPNDIIDAQSPWYLSAEFCLGESKAKFEGYFLTHGGYFSDRDSTVTTSIFTDRKIYRPGQTVYWKAIVYGKYRDNANVCRNASTTIRLADANGQKIEEQQAKTNDFGSAHGQFKIPEGLMNGQFTISDTKSGGSCTFRVEEYKRPTFEVDFQAPDNQVKIGETITVKGSAATYAGIKIQDSKVKYSIIREPQWHGWWSCIFQDQSVIATGETTTDSSGEFQISFQAKPNPADTPSDYLSYRYRVSASVTDISGETRSASCAISAGYRSLFLTTSLPGGLQILESTPLDKVSVLATTINGQPAEADVKVTAFKLKGPSQPRMPKRWPSCTSPIYTREQWDEKFPYLEYQQGDLSLDSLEIQSQIFAATVHASGSQSVDLSAIRQMGTGCYMIKLESADKDGKPVEYEKRIMLFSASGNIADINQCMVMASDKSQYQPGEVATVYLSTALRGVSARYIVSDSRHIIEQKEIEIDCGTAAIKVPISEAQRGGVKVEAYFLKNNRIFSKSLNLSVPFRNKELEVDFETFRDCLYPGEGEKWKIRITDYLGKPADAEMLATLYDESLDALSANSWQLYLYGSSYMASPFDFRLFGASASSSEIGPGNQGYAYMHRPIATSIEWFGHTPRFFSRSAIFMMGAGAKRGKGIVFSKSRVCDNAPMMATAEMEVMDMEDNSMPVMMDESSGDAMDGAAEETEDFGNAEIRTNFSELAFFEPCATTDSNGELYIEFTVPESITKWKMMGLAHTRCMELGYAENHLVTKKDFSVQPNLPRFLRCGDEIEIPVKISNLTTDGAIKGQVKLEILDASGSKALEQFQIASPLQDFEAAPGATISKPFAIKVPQIAEPAIIKVTGVSGGKSDGEQHMLPVLTDKQLVTEAITLSARANQKRQYEFSSWKNSKSETMSSHSFTLEYSSNPAWYAVASLPWLADNPYDSYDCTFARLFANAISGLIIENNPQIEQMLRTWNSENSQVLTSPLQKNQELKGLLIEETPWAVDAKNENERMGQLQNLLDRNRINGENAKLIKKLEEGQLSNGAWPWFAGMRPSAGITQYIALGLGKMRHMGASLDERIDKMLKKAMKYLDSEIVEYHKECVRLNSEPGFFGYQYMYMRTFFPEYKMGKRTQEAYDFVMEHAKKNWGKLHIHNQALLCATFRRAGQEQIARDIIESLRDRAIRSDEFGMYYNENVNGILFHEQNIETQAQIIEAFQEFKMDSEVEELKIWLIKNRQANNWKTAKATTEAVYAMFLCGSKIKCDEPLCKISLGGNPVDMTGAEKGTGYFKQQWQAGSIDISMADITVENPNDHISYGAAYLQYFESLDKIKKADNKLKIEKQMMLAKQNAKGETLLQEIKDGSQVHPGDKITVRFVIKTDRDLEYVHLKDMRAAGLEPANVLSQTKFQDGLIYYQSTKDASENFFIEHLSKGTYVFEYQLMAVHAGNFSNGIATIQCMYAPEFVAHTQGTRLSVQK